MSRKTITEILEGYPEINNLSELLDSDILILPLHKDDNTFGSKQFEIAEEDKTIRIKYYKTDTTRYEFQASVDTVINLGLLVVSAIDVLTRLAELLKERHREDTIKTTIYAPTVNNYYIGNTFNGSGTDVGNQILEFEDNIR